jgi:hypothetical protein
MKSKLFLLFVLFFVLAVWAQNSVIWVQTGSVADYSHARSLGYNVPDLSGDGVGPHYEADVFVNSLISRINAGYSYISTASQQLKDAFCTQNIFTNHQPDMFDICFYSGHGYNYHFRTYDYPIALDYEGSATVNFGGYFTKWVFFNSCETLNNTTATNYLPAFNGCHTILGHQAKMWFLKIPYCKWKFWLFGWQCGEWGDHHTYDQWSLFATNWCDNHITDPYNNGLWDSYNKAVNQEIYQTCGYGIAPAIVWIWGYHNYVGNYCNGRNEHFTANGSQYMWPTNTPNGPFIYSGICYYYETHGNPSY